MGHSLLCSSDTSHGTWCEVQKQFFFRNTEQPGLTVRPAELRAQDSPTPEDSALHGDNSWLLSHAIFAPGSMPGALLACEPCIVDRETEAWRRDMSA